MVFSTKKRFIAGVTCPKCGQLDKVVAFSEGDVNFRECVACGFKDEIRVNSPPREPETRVNRKTDSASETKPVKIID